MAKRLGASLTRFLQLLPLHITWVVILAHDRKAMAAYLRAGMSEVNDEA